MSERDIQHEKSRNANLAIAAQWEVCSFGQFVCLRVERESCSYLIRRDCGERTPERIII